MFYDTIASVPKTSFCFPQETFTAVTVLVSFLLQPFQVDCLFCFDTYSPISTGTDISYFLSFCKSFKQFFITFIFVLPFFILVISINYQCICSNIIPLCIITCVPHFLKRYSQSPIVIAFNLQSNTIPVSNAPFIPSS